MKDNKYTFLRTSTPIKKKSNSFLNNKDYFTDKSYKFNCHDFNSRIQFKTHFINVFCRFHPINELEYLYSNKEGIKIISPTNLLIKGKNSEKFIHEYKFHEIFEQNIHVTSFYNKTCKNIINAVFQGYNGGIILIGENFSYKTYIIKEIIPQLIRDLYQNIYLSDNNEIFKTEIGVYEINQEEIRDLIKEYNNSYLNNRRNEKEKIIYMNCNNENEMEKAIKYGIDNENRDENFDKNHLIIEIKIYRYDKEKNLLKCGKLYIIRLETDIEEDVNKSIRSKKGDNNVNNKSMKYLSELVIDIINKQKNDNDVNNTFDGNKNALISILNNCLGGNAFTSLILTCSKSEYQLDTKMNFFNIVKETQKIKNNPLINVQAVTNSNPFIKDLLVNNINKILKESINGQIDIHKNNFIASNFVNNMKYILEEQKNNYKKNNGNCYKSSDNSLFYSVKKNKNQSKIKNFHLSENIEKKNKITDLFLHNSFYPKEISKYKNKVEELKLKIEEKENQTLDLHNELNDKKAELLLVTLEKEKIMNRIEDKLSEKDEQILNLEKSINLEKKMMENNLYLQIKNSESIIRGILNEKKEKDEIIFKYKDILDNYDKKMKELEMNYQQYIEENNQKNSDYESQINNYKMKISELTNDNYIKDSLIKKMKGEIQILKSELSVIKSKNNKYNKKEFDNEMDLKSNIKSKKEEDKILLENYSSKIKDLQNELNSLRLQKNKDDNAFNHNLLKINELESQLKENQIIIDEYISKNKLMNQELNEAKNSILNLQMEKANVILEKNKELLSNEKIKNDINFKNINLEKELEVLKKKVNNLKSENENLKNKINNYKEFENKLENPNGGIIHINNKNEKEGSN